MTSSVAGVLAGVLTLILCALAIPHLETSLTFLPIIVISVLIGFVASKVYGKVKNSN
jgi:putative flippase GtrA